MEREDEPVGAAKAIAITPEQRTDVFQGGERAGTQPTGEIGTLAVAWVRNAFDVDGIILRRLQQPLVRRIINDHDPGDRRLVPRQAIEQVNQPRPILLRRSNKNEGVKAQRTRTLVI